MGTMLQDKVIVVTGAGRGIGRAIAELAGKQGAKVLVNDLGGAASGEGQDMGVATEVAKAITDAGGQAAANGDSVADAKGASSIIQQAMDTWGKVDCVVNNAGILRDRIFHKMSHEDWEVVIQVHLMGSFYMSKAVAQQYRENGGSFVHFTSTSGLIGQIGQSNYAAAKMGIVGLSNSIARDMGRYGVRSNCVAPFAWSRLIGTIPTDTPEQEARVAKIKSMVPEQIAPLVVFLASDAAKDVNGQIFTVRKNEIFLMSQPRPIRAVHRSEGWSPETVAEHMLPAFQPSFFDLDVSGTVFSWDPI